MLAKAVIGRMGGDFWACHRRTIDDIGEPLKVSKLAGSVIRSVAGRLLSPGEVLARALRPLGGGSIHGRAKSHFVTVVSGLPRSGTSMMMRMLEAGGMPVLSDGIRRPDGDNPKGYYEFEPVKKLADGDHAWLTDARGMAVKIISELLRSLPSDYRYRVVFMQRDIDEVLASQRTMLYHRGKGASGSREEAELATLFQKHLEVVQSWIAKQPNVEVLYVSYNDLLSGPAEQLKRVSDFLGGSLDSSAMAAVVDPAMYKHRRSRSVTPPASS